MIRKHRFKTLAVAAALMLAGSSAAWAAVTPLDTFSFDVAGFNSTSGVGYIITPQETATFGTSQTYTAAGVNGQDITINSSETVNGATTTDVFTVTTPTNFLTTANVNGTKITALQFDLGDANSGSNTVDYLLPITGYTDSGYILYGAANTQFALTPGVTTTNGDMSLSMGEGVNYGTSAIYSLAIHQFTFSVTYPTAQIPEPSSTALCMVGALGLLIGVQRYRRNRRMA
jgi:hypothetical protein